MIIDAHAHTINPRGLSNGAPTDRGAHGRPRPPKLSDEEVVASLKTYDRPGRRELDAVERFEDSIKRIYFDTCLYSRAALELLLKTIGPDNCLFGTERPGTGSARDPITGSWMDDIKPHIDSFEWLSDEDRKKVYEDNVRRLYKLDV